MIYNHGHRLIILFPALLLFLLCPYVAASQAASCDVSTYGEPEKNDCLHLFEKFTSSQNLQTRFFDEEQLRADSENNWPGVANLFEQPIVQLPKFYSMSKPIPCTAVVRDYMIVRVTYHPRYLQLCAHAIHKPCYSSGPATRHQQLASHKVVRKHAHTRLFE